MITRVSSISDTSTTSTKIEAVIVLVLKTEVLVTVVETLTTVAGVRV